VPSHGPGADSRTIAPVPRIDTAGTELYYERAGDGEPMLLIMGMSGSRLAWGDPFVARLRESFEVVAFDNRGMGDSGRAELPFTIGDMAADSLGLLDALEIQRAHIVGVSMGGAIAQDLALDHPDRVRTLTLGATFCGGPEASLMSREDLELLGRAYASGEAEQVFRTMWKINLSPTYRADEANFAPWRRMAASLPAPRPVVIQQMQACGEHDTSERLNQLSVPTLVIHGTADRLIDVANGKLIARLIPAPLELLEDVGHLFWWEQPDRSAELIREHALAAV
jgi:pimeloyl-ACP methyl ester carboxylesterase